MNEYQKKGRPDPAPGPGGGRPVRGPGLRILPAGNVADAVEQTWTDAAGQIKTVVDTVVFPALSLVLAIAFFVKLAMAYFDYRKHGQFEWTGPAILFVCLIFVLLAPNYIWNIVGI